MNKAEQKAERLIEIFLAFSNDRRDSIKCAIICVDEIIDSYKKQSLYKQANQVINYWQQVKQILENK